MFIYFGLNMGLSKREVQTFMLTTYSSIIAEISGGRVRARELRVGVRVVAVVSLPRDVE